MNIRTKAFFRKLIPLAAAQFLGVFNDNAFKMTSVLAAMSLSEDYSNDSAFLGLITIVFVLPFLFMAPLTGYLADRHNKRTVMIGSKIAEFAIMALGAFALWKVPDWGVYPLVLIMFLMAAQSTFFSPAFNGSLPEQFSEQDLSHANGNIQMFSFFAVIMGVAGGIVFKAVVGNQLVWCGVLFMFFSLLGLIASFMIRSRKIGDMTREWDWNCVKTYIAGLRKLWQNRPVFLAASGDAFFCALGTMIQSLLIVFGKYNLDMTNEVDLGALQLVMALGIGFGCYMAGKLSADKIELGLVPFGSIIITVFLLLMTFFPGVSFAFGSHLVYPWVLICLIIAGFGGGLFIIPLRATQQFRTDPKNRGTILASSNVLCFSAILVSGLLMLVLASGAEKSTSPEGFIQIAQSYFLNLNPATMLIGVAVGTFLITFTTFILIPEYVARFWVVSFTHTFYRVRVKGAEHIPERGPVLLVANHVSFVDGLLIMAGTSRMVRFLMHEDYYRIPFLKFIFQWGGFVMIPRDRNPKKLALAIEKTRELLRAGEAVCVFPEAEITRNGLMGIFKPGFKKMIPEELDIPIIPVHLGGVWGSIFSFFHGKISFRLPLELPYPVNITVGEPVPRDIPPEDLRATIQELSAEGELEPLPGERPIHAAFVKIAKRHPREIRVRDFDGRTLSNLELLTAGIIMSQKLRRLIDERNLNSPQLGILMPSCTGGAIATLSALLADRVPAMLNFTASSESMDEAIKLARIELIITSKAFIAKANIAKRPQMIFLEDLAKEVTTRQKMTTFARILLTPSRILSRQLSPKTFDDTSNTAAIIFSSGSTGLPKGIMLSHRNLNSNVTSFLKLINLQRDDKIVGNLPIFHSFGFNVCFWVPLLSGVEVVYVPNPLDAESVCEAIDRHNLTFMTASPTFLQMYLRKGDPKKLSKLRLVITGAEKLRKDIAKRFKTETGLEVTEGFGCTELSPVVSINLPDNVNNVGKEIGRIGSVGAPINGVCVKVVDPDSGAKLPVGQTGAFHVKGPNVMKGYLNDPEKTEEVLDHKWYNTGDMASVAPTGHITIQGRLSRFSKLGGEMVPHELVENAIHEIIDDGRKIVVTGAHDEAKGEKLMVLHTDLPITPSEIIEKLREAGLPNLWTPKARDFIKIDEIPLLGSGKLDLKAVRVLAASLG